MYIFGGHGLKGRAKCRQTEVQTNRQTDKRSLGPTPRIGEQTKNRQGAGAPIPVLTYGAYA